VTFNDFPPDDGTYSVSYDFHLLDPGFSTVQSNTADGCVLEEFRRCRITLTQEQLNELLRSMEDRALAHMNF